MEKNKIIDTNKAKILFKRYLFIAFIIIGLVFFYGLANHYTLYETLQTSLAAGFLFMLLPISGLTLIAPAFIFIAIIAFGIFFGNKMTAK